MDAVLTHFLGNLWAAGLSVWTGGAFFCKESVLPCGPFEELGLIFFELSLVDWNVLWFLW